MTEKVEPEDFVQIFGAHLRDTTHLIAARLKHLVRVFETVPFPYALLPLLYLIHS